MTGPQVPPALVRHILAAVAISAAQEGEVWVSDQVRYAGRWLVRVDDPDQTARDWGEAATQDAANAALEELVDLVGPVRVDLSDTDVCRAVEVLHVSILAGER